MSTEYQYDPASRLTALSYRNAAGPLGNLTYAYDTAGNRTGNGGSLSRTLLPDPVSAATYDPANRQLAFGGQPLSYDANGNLTGDNTTTYTWDARNRLVALTGPTTASFQYDALGRRAQKTVNTSTTQFLYDRLNPVLEATEGGLQTVLLTGFTLDEYLTRTDSTGMLGLLVDALGSTVALTDLSGTATTSYSYEPFGRTEVTGSSSGNALQYTGRENDGTGLYYYRARYYGPGPQRFISEDPIRFEGGSINLYAYAINSPLNWIDPHGLDVTVSLYECCGPYNHVGIGVNTSRTVGFRPIRPNAFLWPGEVSDDATNSGRLLQTITIKTTAAQDAAIQRYIDERRARPGWYNALSGRHCGGFVRDALGKGHIDLQIPNSNPNWIFSATEALVGDVPLAVELEN